MSPAALQAAFWSGMLDHLWQSSLLLALLWLLARTLRHAPARLLDGLWWTGLIKLFLPLPWLGPLVGRVVGPPESGAAAGPSGFYESVVVWLRASPLDPVAAAPQPSVWPLALLTALWACGAFLLLTRWRRRLARDRTVGIDTVPPPLREKLQTVLASTAIPPGTVRIDQTDRLPTVAGCWRPRILLPLRLIERLDPASIRCILLHEDAHCRRRDPLRAAAQRLALALFFFYPPLWWLIRRLRESAELACDEAVLRAGVPPSRYATALARAVRLGLEPPRAPAAVGLGGESGFARRLERIRRPGRYRVMKRHRLTLAMAIAVAVALSLLPTPDGPHAGKGGGPGGAGDGLDALLGLDVPVRLQVKQLELRRVLRMLEVESGVTIRVEGPAERPITIGIEEPVPAREALRRLARAHGLSYRVAGPDELLVRVPHLAGVQGVTNPQLVSRVQPVYPERARQEGVGGTVMLQAVILHDGTVGAIQVLREDPAGYGFADSAIEALAQWSYLPAELDGLAVDVWFVVVVTFEAEPTLEET